MKDGIASLAAGGHGCGVKDAGCLVRKRSTLWYQLSGRMVS
jgi:hypothetical protein